MFKTQTLAKGHLNLGAWHGFQEVFYKDPLLVNEVEFDFLLEPDAYICLLLRGNEGEISGIRISANSKFENMFLMRPRMVNSLSIIE